MAENNTNTHVIGTTRRYNENIISMLIAAVVIVAVILGIVFFWFGINSRVRQAMREAKDIRIAMKMKAIEQYGLGGTMYQPTAKDGLAKGIEEELLNMAEADGEIVLHAWDVENNEPDAFTYYKDRYIIMYRESSDGSPIWNGYYTFKLLEYE